MSETGIPAAGRMPLALAQRKWREIQPKKAKEPDPTVERDLRPGWLLDYLFPLETMIWGRWEYWELVQSASSLPDARIPAIDFHDCNQHAEAGRKMLTRCLNAVSGEWLHGDAWMGWSSFDNFNYLLDWLLFGFGHPGYSEPPKEPTNGASMRLYQLFDLAPLLLWPYDHIADMLAECRHGRHKGFFPTPESICELMVKMTMPGGEEMHDKTVCDPACGTGRMLLHASNHSLRLYGQDIDLTVCKAALVNGYLFAPWLSRPIWWMDRATLVHGNTLGADPGRAVNGGEKSEEIQTALAYFEARSEAITEQAPPHIAQGQLFDTEFDAAGTAQTAPVIKRRPKPRQPGRGVSSPGLQTALDLA